MWLEDALLGCSVICKQPNFCIAHCCDGNCWRGGNNVSVIYNYHHLSVDYPVVENLPYVKYEITVMFRVFRPLIVHVLRIIVAAY